MGTYLGADWASNGWVAAELDDEHSLSVGFYPTIWGLWYDRGADADRILVDIPIGLSEDGRRACDREAKALLGDRRSSAFWTPIRDAVYEDNVEAAKQIQTETMDHSISNQAWAIVPRIREVDTFLRETATARELVRESHPEVCFWALNDDEPVGAKSDDEGLDARQRVLTSTEFLDRGDCEEAIETLAEPSYARFATEDDVLDATVLAVTARHVAAGAYSTLPDESETDGDHPPKDDEGIPMEIVYPEG